MRGSYGKTRPRNLSKKGLVTEKLTKYDVQKTSSKENQKRQEQKESVSQQNLRRIFYFGKMYIILENRKSCPL